MGRDSSTVTPREAHHWRTAGHLHAGQRIYACPEKACVRTGLTGPNGRLSSVEAIRRSQSGCSTSRRVWSLAKTSWIIAEDTLHLNSAWRDSQSRLLICSDSTTPLIPRTPVNSTSNG